MRADKLSFRDFKDAKLRKPSFVNVKSPSSGEVKLLTKEEFATLDNDGKITTEYGTRMKQGGGEMIDYTDVTYYFKE